MSIPPLMSPRKRSSSKTQQNFHPMNSTSILDLSTGGDGADCTEQGPGARQDDGASSQPGRGLSVETENLHRDPVQVSTPVVSSMDPTSQPALPDTPGKRHGQTLETPGQAPPHGPEQPPRSRPPGHAQDLQVDMGPQPQPVPDRPKPGLPRKPIPAPGQPDHRQNPAPDRYPDRTQNPDPDRQPKSEFPVPLDTGRNGAAKTSSKVGGAAKAPCEPGTTTNIKINRTANGDPTPLPHSAASLKPKSTLKKSSSDNTRVPSSAIPKLKKYVHVVKLVSPDQPNEYLKILNIPLYPDTLKIGRQNTPKTSNKITDGFFDSRVLSRNHAELFIKENQLFIRDLKSSNGTFINDLKLEPYKDYKVSIDDKIDLGTTLESQMAHKKITCIIKEFEFVTLKKFQDLVDEINNKDDLISKKLELFNSTFDALIFGEIVDDIIVDNSTDHSNDLLDLINYNEPEAPKVAEINKSIKFQQGLDLKMNSNPQDMIKKLIVSVNNEFIQQQRLKEMNIFLKNYNNSIAGQYHTDGKSNMTFKVYEELLKSDNNNDILKFHDDSDRRRENERHRRQEQQHQQEQQQMREKYDKLEEKFKKAVVELDLIRGHLSTAKSKEMEMSNYEMTNKNLERSLSSSKTELHKLRKRLSESEKGSTEKDETVKNLKDQLKKLQSQCDEQKRRHENTKATMLHELSSNAFKYSGFVVLSVAFLYYLTPVGLRNITDIMK